MFSVGVDFEFVVYLVIQWVFWQYVFDGDFDYVFWVVFQCLGQGFGFQVVDVIGEMVIYFVLQFFVGDGNFFCIDDDQVVVGINVWGVDWFVFVMQMVGQFGGEMVQGFVFGVDEVLVVLDGFVFGSESVYEEFYVRLGLLW